MTSRRFVSPEDYTPKHLAEKILISRSALEGERKQVTVLFADIKDSTELVADRDPEEARKILDPVIDHMMAAVHQYEGTVNRVLGDGIMALFGAPIAHEDHAVRACYAALRMQETLACYADDMEKSGGIPVTIRIGLNSGDILVLGIGRDLNLEYSVIGHTVHLAARMEQMAKPGSVLTTASTLRLAEGHVEATSLGLVPVRGLSEPMAVYEVKKGGLARTRLQAAIRRGLTRLVGRDNEIKQLHQAIGRARTGKAQIVAVMGQPGVGKSRLIHEVIHSPEMTDWMVLESNSVSYGRATPYLPIVGLLVDFFEITDRSSPQLIRDRVTGKILPYGPALQDVIPPVLDLFDVLDDGHPFRSLDPIQHRQRTHDAITRLLLSASQTRAVLAFFEDLHWSDSLTLGLLDKLAVRGRNSPLLLVATYRPEHRDGWKELPNYQQICLEPLGGDSVVQLLEALLGPDSSLLHLKRLVLDGTGGNPFFIEEIVRGLTDSHLLHGTPGSFRLAKPLANIEVPPTVQAVLGARIDTLSPIEKRVLQEAAVIGHNVPHTLLYAICGLAEDDLRRLLGKLQAAEFLYTTQVFPDLQYSFKHSLTHDVAYSGLLHERRRDIHARIVRVLEEVHTDPLGEQLERLAVHALRGQLWEKAINYLRQAGTRSADREAYREAATLFEQALSALVQLPESPINSVRSIETRFELRNALQPLGERERIAECLQEAGLLAERLNNTRHIGWVQSYLTDHFWMLGRYEDAAIAGEKALAIGEQISDLPLQVVTNLPLGLAYHTRGDYPSAIERFHWNASHLFGEQVYERFGMFVLPSSFSLSFVAWACGDMGNFAEGYKAGEKALQIAESARHPFSCGYAHLGLGVLALRKGSLDPALKSFELALGSNGFSDSPVGFAYTALHLGYAQALAGDPIEGIRTLEKSVTIAESKGFVARHSLRLSYLSEVYLMVGRESDAHALATRSWQLASEHDERANQAYALRIIVKTDAHCGRLLDAEVRLSTALQLSEALGMRPLQAYCHRDMANIFEAKGQLSSAITHSKSASALLDMTGMRFLGDGSVNS